MGCKYSFSHWQIRRNYSSLCPLLSSSFSALSLGPGNRHLEAVGRASPLVVTFAALDTLRVALVCERAIFISQITYRFLCVFARSAKVIRQPSNRLIFFVGPFTTPFPPPLSFARRRHLVRLIILTRGFHISDGRSRPVTCNN